MSQKLLSFILIGLVVVGLSIKYFGCPEPIPDAPNEDGVVIVDTPPPILDLGDQDLDVVTPDGTDVRRERMQVPDSVDVSDTEVVVSVVDTDSVPSVTHIIIEDKGSRWFAEFGLMRGDRKIRIRRIGDDSTSIYVTPQRIPLIGFSHTFALGLNLASNASIAVSYIPLRVWGFNLGAWTGVAPADNEKAGDQFDFGPTVQVKPLNWLAIGATYSVIDRTAGVIVGVSVTV